MSLNTTSSVTAAVLMRAMDMLHDQVSPETHALLTANERMAALQQLLVTTETAAKLADVAHVEAAAAAAERNAAGADTDRIRAETERFKAEAAKIGKEVERVMAETERARVEAERGRSVTEQEAAATAPLETAAAAVDHPKPLETLDVRPNIPTEDISIPPSVTLPGWNKVYGVYRNSLVVQDIVGSVERWNKSDKEIYTPAGWAWFKQNSNEAYLLLDRAGDGYTALLGAIRNKEGIIKLPESILEDLNVSLGYNQVIYGCRRGDGKRDIAEFV
ncbi:hypothetical protein DFP73DRAFT_285604 [Morchella snyderi]|nr:hypothetical protein DFP73DRAFT_285604 [Morchella snyderi]